MLAAETAHVLADPHGAGTGRARCYSSSIRRSTPSARAGTPKTCSSAAKPSRRPAHGFFHIDRGGDITFHGPGQLVGYPILDLERLGIGLRDYIDALEEAVIRTVDRNTAITRQAASPGASGVWIEPEGRRPRKICAIGVRSSRYVTMHGFALNVTTDLEVVLAHQPLRIHRPRRRLDRSPKPDASTLDGGGQTTGCEIFK